MIIDEPAAPFKLVKGKRVRAADPPEAVLIDARVSFQSYCGRDESPAHLGAAGAVERLGHLPFR
jgi:hypothetical protein